MRQKKDEKLIPISNNTRSRLNKQPTEEQPAIAKYQTKSYVNAEIENIIHV